MAVDKELNQERELFGVLIDKIKKSENLYVSKAPRTKYLSRRLFKFDKFDLRVSFVQDSDFIKYAAYGRVEINNDVLSNRHEIADITVTDKQGKIIFARNCMEPILEKGMAQKIQKLRFDKGQIIYDLLLKRSQAIAVKTDIAKQLKHATKNLGQINRLKSMQEPERTAVCALKKIKAL